MSLTDEELIRIAVAQEEQARLIRGLDDTINRLLPLMLKGGNGATNHQTVHQADRTPMWVCVVLVVALVVGTWGRADQSREDISRIQADIRELRAVDQDLRSTDNAVRAYINTGMLKPKQGSKK